MGRFHSAGWCSLLLLGCLSCTGPEVRESPQRASEPVAAVISPQGVLPEKVGEAILIRAAETSTADVEVATLLDAVRQEARAPFITGNAVRALIDGPQTLDAIGTAIERAKHHIHLETYIFADDEVGRQVANQLIRKRSEGVEVRVLYDAIGSVSTPAAFFDELRSKGVEVLAYRPINPTNTLLFWKLNNRDHRKIIVVDGTVGFTGGINVSGAYSQSSASKPGPEAGLDAGWRDTHVRIEGPAVQQLQTLFLATWIRAGGKLEEASPQYHPTMTAKGGDPVAIVASDGTDSSEAAIYAVYLASIRHATRRIWLTQAYFAPNAEFRAALTEAAGRGVDVRVVVPGFTDSGLIFHAARAYYDELMSGGVRLFEQRDALVHAKTAVIDGIVSTVGSANLDMRSFIHNNEANAVVVSRDFGQVMERTFERDLKASLELDLDTWRSRGLLPRLKETGSRLFSYWL